MKRFEHGGAAHEHPGMLDFSANLNPLGMPTAVREAVRGAVERFDTYPDPASTELVAAIAAREGVSARRVLACAGATDAMTRVCLALRPRRALVCAPCYSGYEQALEQAGAEIVRFGLAEPDDFGLDEAAAEHLAERLAGRLAAPVAEGGSSEDTTAPVAEGGASGNAAGCLVTGSAWTRAAAGRLAVPVAEGDASEDATAPVAEGGSSGDAAGCLAGGSARTRAAGGSDAGAAAIDMLFLANPNNPTGLTIARPLLERILETACARGITVVLDECFIDFTDEPSAADLIGRFANLVIVKAFTKIYAMAGLRLGYLVCADEDRLERFAAMGQMWAVSTPAQVAGLAALAEEGFVERSRAYVAACRAELSAQLAALGLHVIPGQANYLMFESPRALYDPLLERGIVVRRCENYVGVDNRWFRVAVRTEDENARLVAALKEVLS